MFKYLITAVLAGIFSMIAYVFIHLGAFKPVEIAEKPSSELRLFYKEHTGAYHKIVPIIQEVESWAKQNGIDCTISFGEFMDKPEEIEEERRRSRGGCILTAEQSNEFVLSKHPPADFKFFTYPARRTVTAVFSGSPSIGPWKVYSEVLDFITENRLEQAGPVIETYRIHSEKSMTTTYLFPIK